MKLRSHKPYTKTVKEILTNYLREIVSTSKICLCDERGLDAAYTVAVLYCASRQLDVKVSPSERLMGAALVLLAMPEIKKTADRIKEFDKPPVECTPHLKCVRGAIDAVLSEYEPDKDHFSTDAWRDEVMKEVADVASRNFNNGGKPTDYDYLLAAAITELCVNELTSFAE